MRPFSEDKKVYVFKKNVGTKSGPLGIPTKIRSISAGPLSAFCFRGLFQPQKTVDPLHSCPKHLLQDLHKVDTTR